MGQRISEILNPRPHGLHIVQEFMKECAGCKRYHYDQDIFNEFDATKIFDYFQIHRPKIKDEDALNSAIESVIDAQCNVDLYCACGQRS